MLDIYQGIKPRGRSGNVFVIAEKLFMLQDMNL
nr:MAG TPA: hypothetical protein [Bacteriophage sp.]